MGTRANPTVWSLEALCPFSKNPAVPCRCLQIELGFAHLPNHPISGSLRERSPKNLGPPFGGSHVSANPAAERRKGRECCANIPAQKRPKLLGFLLPFKTHPNKPVIRIPLCPKTMIFPSNSPKSWRVVAGEEEAGKKEENKNRKKHLIRARIHPLKARMGSETRENSARAQGVVEGPHLPFPAHQVPDAQVEARLLEPQRRGPVVEEELLLLAPAILANKRRGGEGGEGRGGEGRGGEGRGGEGRGGTGGEGGGVKHMRRAWAGA